MIKKLLWVSLGLLINSAVSAADDIDTIRQKFIGDWELASYYTFPVNGSEREMGYIGRLSYDRFGNMAGLGMPKDLPKLQQEFSLHVWNRLKKFFVLEVHSLIL